MCVWPGFVAPSGSSCSSRRRSGKNQVLLFGAHHNQQYQQQLPPRVQVDAWWCMPEKMADSRFQAAPQPMNLAAAAAAPSADMPDLSHLTEEERRIIESVMMRQRQEEERENEIMR